MKTTVIIIVIVLILCIFASCASVPESVDYAKIETPLFIDATQFSKITTDRLIDIMGEPKKIEEWNDMIDSIRGYKITTYYYSVNDTDYSFNFIKGSLTYMIAENYTDQCFGVELNSDIFPRFGIVPKRSNPTGQINATYARWKMISDDIAEVWAQSERDTVNWVKITFDLQYYYERNK